MIKQIKLAGNNNCIIQFSCFIDYYSILIYGIHFFCLLFCFRLRKIHCLQGDYFIQGQVLSQLCFFSCYYFNCFYQCNRMQFSFWLAIIAILEYLFVIGLWIHYCIFSPQDYFDDKNCICFKIIYLRIKNPQYTCLYRLRRSTNNSYHQSWLTNFFHFSYLNQYSYLFYKAIPQFLLHKDKVILQFNQIFFYSVFNSRVQTLTYGSKGNLDPTDSHFFQTFLQLANYYPNKIQIIFMIFFYSQQKANLISRASQLSLDLQSIKKQQDMLPLNYQLLKNNTVSLHQISAMHCVQYDLQIT